jgi:hypothetical protein
MTFSPTDYTDLAKSQVSQRQSISYTGSAHLLQYHLHQLSADVKKLEEKQGFQVGIMVSLNHIFAFGIN